MRRSSLLSLALLLPASARATAFHDEATGLTVYLTVPGATLCFARPAPLREDRPECKELDVAAAQKLEPSISLFALVRFPEWAFAINGTRLPKDLHGPISRTDGRDFVKGWTAQGRAFTAEEPEFLVVNGLQVMRFVSRSSSTQPPMDFLNYLLVGSRGLMTVSFLTDAEHLARVKVVAQAVIASADMPHEDAPRAWTNPVSESPGYRIGVLAMQIAFQLGFLGALCAGAILLYRWLRGRAKGT
jgi:hypothetical protein